MSHDRRFRVALIAPFLAVCALLAPAARAQLVVSDTLTGAASSYNWASVNGACLTAGSASASAGSSIPPCVGLSYYSGKTQVGGVTGRIAPSADPVGQGALRLTNGDTGTGSNGNNQTGAVISNFTFPSDQGVQVTFSTVTYGGNAYGNSAGQSSGADGITFFLADGSVLVPGTSTPATGAYGGSLGYSCSNNKPYPGTEGLPGAYLAVGIDEYGNFVNGATVTQTTTTTVSTTSTATTQTGYIVTDSSGTPTTNPPTWYVSTPATFAVGTTTGSPTTTTATVTNTAPNPTTTTTTGTSYSTPASTVITGTTKHTGSGSSKVYYAMGTYTSAGTSTPTTTAVTSYAITNYGDNTASSDPTNPGPHPSRISVRGSGNVNLAWLRLNYPTLFPSSMSNSAIQTALQNTCATGYPYNNTGSPVTINGQTAPAGGYYPVAVADYSLLGTSQLPAGTTIYNQEAKSSPLRGTAVPITYALSITQNGLLNMSYSYNGGTAIPVITNQSISASNGTVPANLRFGFSAGTGGGSNVHEITCFKAAQLNAASTSAGVNVQQSARVEEGTQVYLAYYHPTNWWGQLTATTLTYDPLTDTVSLPTGPGSANWDASCVLTGGNCNATGGSNTAQPTGTGAAGAGTRQMMTWQYNSSTASGTGVPFQWNSLTAAQQGLLSADTAVNASSNADRLGWLRGDRGNEIGGSGSDAVFRARNGVLGDVVDSSPTWVGPPSLPYKGPWRDALYPTTTMPEGTSYTTFASTNATRTNVVYAGANDGFMHGFRAGAYLANGQFDTTGSIAPNDGQELIGYMPSSALATILDSNTNLDFSSPSYAHALSVDATPGTGDLYYNGAWHTWLAGGMAGGGNANGPIGDNTTNATGGDIFALDITNPGNFSEANAASVVIGDWGPNGSPMPCATSPSTSCSAALLSNLGNTYGTPIIRRLHDGNWGVIFGNGLNSPTGTAGIYIMEVSATGAITFRFLDTGYGPSQDPLRVAPNPGSKNGIAYVSSADLDGDHVTDYVYAGDRFGNLWRFDLTSNNAANWAAGTSPIFSTPGGQPITTRVTVTSALSGNNPGRVMLDFGTGQQLSQTLTSPATYASGTQTIYGIWDWNMSAWNALGSVQYSSLTAPQTITTAKLVTQTATDVNVTDSNGNVTGRYRTVTQNKICWAGSATCIPGTSNTQFGWQLNLPDSGEQIIYSPTTAYGLFIVNTTIPAANQALSCSNLPPTGYTMAIAADTGGAPTSSFFATATNNYVSANGAIVAGIGLSAVGTPSFVSAMTKPYMVNQTSSGVGTVTQVNAGAAGTGQRLNWIKLR